MIFRLRIGLRWARYCGVDEPYPNTPPLPGLMVLPGDRALRRGVDRPPVREYPRLSSRRFDSWSRRMGSRLGSRITVVREWSSTERRSRMSSPALVDWEMYCCLLRSSWPIWSLSKEFWEEKQNLVQNNDEWPSQLWAICANYNMPYHTGKKNTKRNNLKNCKIYFTAFLLIQTIT